MMAVKRMLAGQAVPAAAIHFLLPNDLPSRLPLPESTGRDPGKATLELVMTSLARQRTDRLSQAVANAPASSVQLIERWLKAGHDLEQLQPAGLRELALDWTAYLAERNCASPAMATRQRHAVYGEGAVKWFQRLLIVGFGAEHWEWWLDLGSAVGAAEEVTVCLPRCSDLREERLWLGSWEQRLVVPAESVDSGNTVEFPAGRFFASRGARSLAAALREAMDRRANEASHTIRVGLLDGSGGHLARELAVGFERDQVPYADGFGRKRNTSEEARSWQSWLQWEENRELPAWFTFVENSPGMMDLLPRDGVKQVRDVAMESGFDQLEWVISWLSTDPDPLRQSLGEALEKFPRLPESSSLHNFLEATSATAQQAGWEWRIQPIQRGVPERLGEELLCERRDFLRWLAAVADVPERFRSELGSEVFARIELLRPGQGELREWDLLILTGLAEGQWPSDPVEAPFVGDAPLQAINEQLMDAQVGAILQGDQGEGHEALPQGRGWFLTADGRRRIEQLRLAELGGASEIWYATTLAEELEPEVPVEPGAYFLEAWSRHLDQPFTETALAELRVETDRLAAAHLERHSETVNGLEAVREAFNARRDRHTPFGPYDCALTKAPAEALNPSASRWDRVVASPGEIWFRDVLGLPGVPDRFEEGVRNGLVLGVWQHRWAALIPGRPGQLLPIPALDEALGRIDRASGQHYRRGEETAAMLASPLGAEWISFWEEAKARARTGAERTLAIAGELQMTRIATEWWLPRNLVLETAGALPVRGKLDLLLATAQNEDQPAGDLACIDYKNWTGGPIGDPLPHGLQLFLYGEALASLEQSGEVRVFAILRDGTEYEIPKNFGNRPSQALLEALAKLGSTLRLGMMEPKSPRFAPPADLPVAILPIGFSQLFDRWKLTHPMLTRASAKALAHLEASP